MSSTIKDTILDQDIDSLFSDLERDLLFNIILNMRHKKISAGEAQRLAQEFLEMQPIRDKEDLFEKLKKLADKYPEARAVYIKYAVPYYEKQMQNTLDTVVEYFHKGEIDKAIAAAQEGNQTHGS